MTHTRLYSEQVLWCTYNINLAGSKDITSPVGELRGSFWALGWLSLSDYLSAVLLYFNIDNRETPAPQQNTTSTTTSAVSSTTVSTASCYFFQSFLLCVLLHPLRNRMFPSNHSNSEVAVGNATVFIFYSFFFFVSEG